MAFYGASVEEPLTFSVGGSGSCAAAPPSGAVSFACGQAGEIEAEGSGGAGFVKLLWQPGERVQYYALAGLGDYSVKAPSTTVSNVLTGDNRGLVFGAGLRASLIPDTAVSPGLAVDASLVRSQYAFNRRTPVSGAAPGANISQRLELLRYQISVLTGHQFDFGATKTEPYAGLRWSRTQADLKDLVDGAHAGGAKDVVTPLLGVRVPFQEREAFFAEASFVGGMHYGAGVELRF